MMQIEKFTQYKGIFKKGFIEPSTHGFSLFTPNGTFIGEMMEQGFAVDKEFEHREEVVRKLSNAGISVFDYDTFHEIELEQIIDGAIYEH